MSEFKFEVGQRVKWMASRDDYEVVFRFHAWHDETARRYIVRKLSGRDRQWAGTAGEVVPERDLTALPKRHEFGGVVYEEFGGVCPYDVADMPPNTWWLLSDTHGPVFFKNQNVSWVQYGAPLLRPVEIKQPKEAS